MLAVEAQFPHPGSLALALDRRLPQCMQGLEMVRVIEVGHAAVLISFPLRIGASGNVRVPLADLVDGTPLTRDEEAELESLKYLVAHRSRRWRKLQARCQALRSRQIHAIILNAERAKWAAAMVDAREAQRIAA